MLPGTNSTLIFECMPSNADELSLFERTHYKLIRHSIFCLFVGISFKLRYYLLNKWWTQWLKYGHHTSRLSLELGGSGKKFKGYNYFLNDFKIFNILILHL
jgi:hypothetical protein